MSEDKEPVGSVAEEAARLLGALQGWARENGPESASAGAAGVASLVHNVNEHIATGGQDCAYCPVCQAISFVRQTSPEVKQHLSTAASSLLQALSTAFATPPGPERPGRSGGGPFEKIRLDDDGLDAD